MSVLKSRGLLAMAQVAQFATLALANPASAEHIPEDLLDEVGKALGLDLEADAERILAVLAEADPAKKPPSCLPKPMETPSVGLQALIDVLIIDHEQRPVCEQCPGAAPRRFTLSRNNETAELDTPELDPMTAMILVQKFQGRRHQKNGARKPI